MVYRPVQCLVLSTQCDLQALCKIQGRPRTPLELRFRLQLEILGMDKSIMKITRRPEVGPRRGNIFPILIFLRQRNKVTWITKRRSRMIHVNKKKRELPPTVEQLYSVIKLTNFSTKVPSVAETSISFLTKIDKYGSILARVH